MTDKKDCGGEMTPDEYYGWIWFATKGPGLCGCGDTEGVLELLHGYLDAVRRLKTDGRTWFLEKTGRGPDGETTLQWLFYYWVDRMDLIEHGGTVRFSWLTEDGEAVLDAMDKYGTDLDALEKLREKPEDAIIPKFCEWAQLPRRDHD